MTGIHTPDFFAVTPEERARGYSSRCQTCGLPLVSSIEFIGYPCPGFPAAWLPFEASGQTLEP